MPVMEMPESVRDPSERDEADIGPVEVPEDVFEALADVFEEVPVDPAYRNVIADIAAARDHIEAAEWIRTHPREYAKVVTRGCIAEDADDDAEPQTPATDGGTTLTGAIAPSEVCWLDSGAVDVIPPRFRAGVDSPTATARSVPTVNGLQYGRDECECGEPWSGYLSHPATDAEMPGVVHVLICNACDHTERETQYFATRAHDESEGAL